MKYRALKFCPACIFILILFVTSASFLNAQSRSRIVGTVTDAKTGEALVGVNVIVLDTYLGAATSSDGKFFIVNVPVGTYSVKASMIGYKTQIIKNVVVSSDRVTNLDFSLQSSVIQSNEVVVTAKSDHLHKEVSSTQIVADAKELSKSASVRSISSFLTRQAGVSTDNGFLSIRGGSPDQTGTIVNGLSFNNAAVGNAETSIPLSAIEQVSVLSGGYNAEYGNFRSGLINVTTKSGTKNGYHGTIDLSMDQSHVRRFGQSLHSAHNDLLAPYLDPSIAFTGGKNDKMQELGLSFDGWNKVSESYNKYRPANQHATPLDMYLLAAWTFMTEPDYNGLAKLGYSVPESQKQLFAQHSLKENGNDYNFDGGFGGPIPFVSKLLGGATFYISNNTSTKHYVEPVTLNKDMSSTTLLTMKTNLNKSMTLTLNGLWKREIGVSPIRPPWGDPPDAADRGGFMPLDNTKYYSHDPTYWYDAPFFPILNQTTTMTGLTFNHVINNSTYYQVTLNALTIKDYTPVGDNRDTSMITQFGPFPVDQMPYGKLQFAPSHHVDGFTYPGYDALPGITLFRFRSKEGDLYDNSKVYQYEAKFDIASQINESNYVKAGFEYNLINLDHNFWEKWNNNAYNTYEFNYHRKPSQTGFYVQDQINYHGIIANVGVRFDYYYGGGGLWPSKPFAEAVYTPQKVDTSLYSYLNSGSSYIWDIWRNYDKTHPGFLQPIKNFFTVSPRIGVSFPVTTNSKFYFNYGQFRSNPPYYSMYQFRYRYDKNGLYAMSNPNLDPPKTISYELGMAYNFYQSYILKISGYYKDVTGQHGTVTYQSSDNVLNYDSWANNEYQDIQGLEINIGKNDNSWITGWINFNYMLEKKGYTGKSIISDKNINNDQAGLYQGDESRSLPRPDINANITFHSPDHWGPQLGGIDLFGDWDLSFYGKWQAGGYFTWNPLGKLHVTDNMQWPDYFMIDMKLGRTIKIAGITTHFYLDVSNLFNMKVNMIGKGYAFSNDLDETNYLASLHLPMYNSPEFDALRKQAQSKGKAYYVAGNDKVGDLQSASKPYIDNPDFASFFMYGRPRDIWFGMKVDF